MTARTFTRCPGTVSGVHVFGTRQRCLGCATPAPPRPRQRTSQFADVVAAALLVRPGAHVGRTQNPGVEDIAGWGEDGDPWT